MSIYKLWSRGHEVQQIQKALSESGFLKGSVDGIYGQQTETAVKSFQTSVGLTADGVVGPATWGKLFAEHTSHEIVEVGDVSKRCLALTGTFETGHIAPECFATVAGDFDGQGMSYGALQWNFGQGTLQPLLLQMINEHRTIMSTIFGADLSLLEQAINNGKQASIAFAHSIQDSAKKHLLPAWRDKFKQLGLTPEFQAIEVHGASVYYQHAIKLVEEYGLWSNRGRALMFDICVQNGSISSAVKSLIMADIAKLSSSLSREEHQNNV